MCIAQIHAWITEQAYSTGTGPGAQVACVLQSSVSRKAEKLLWYWIYWDSSCAETNYWCPGGVSEQQSSASPAEFCREKHKAMTAVLCLVRFGCPSYMSVPRGPFFSQSVHAQSGTPAEHGRTSSEFHFGACESIKCQEAPPRNYWSLRLSLNAKKCNSYMTEAWNIRGLLQWLACFWDWTHSFVASFVQTPAEFLSVSVALYLPTLCFGK